MYKQDMPLIICDIETAGLKVEHDIIQIAAVVVSTKDFVEKEAFEVKLKFDRTKADQTALEINHYTEKAWENAVTIEQGLKQLQDLFRRYSSAQRVSARGKTYTVAIAGGYNSNFDAERILYQSRKLSIFQPVDPRFLDVMQLAFWKQLDLANYKLTSVAQKLNISIEDAHDALADVRITVKVLQELLRLP